MEVKNSAAELAVAMGKAAGAARSGKNRQSEPGRESGEFDRMIREKCRTEEHTGETEPVGGAVREQPEPQNEEKREAEAMVCSEAGQLLAAALMFRQPTVQTEISAEQEEATPEAMPRTEEISLELLSQMESVPAAESPEPASQSMIPLAEQPAVQTAREQAEQVFVPKTAAERETEQELIPAVQEEQSVRTDVRASAEETAEVRQVIPERMEAKEEPEEIRAEAPLFPQTEAVPVKVADPEVPLELESPEATEQLAKIVVSAAEQQLSKVELTLTPENLGKLTVEITRTAEGALSVVVHAVQPRAAAILEQNSGNLQQLLAAGTKGEVTVEVRGNQEAQQQFLNPDDARQHQQRRQDRQKEERKQADNRDFLHQLRLGLAQL